MRHRRSVVLQGMFTLVGILFLVLPASATTYSRSYSYGSNLGSLSYTATSTSLSCDSAYGVVDYTRWVYSGFTYADSQAAINQSISGSTWYDLGIGGRYVGSGDCPDASSSRGPTITYSGSGYTITIDAGTSGYAGTNIVVPGYVDPKYIVVGITYAPPGNGSNVNYTSSSLVSTTNSINSSFTSGYTESVSDTSSYILGWKYGGLDTSTTASDKYSQSVQTSSSSSVTVSRETSTGLTVPGPQCPYTGVDHDYDIIWVWLNPVALFTLTNGGSVTWNGYGFSSLDQPEMDVIGIVVGCLNGDLNCNSQLWGSSTQPGPLVRAWASGESWPSGGTIPSGCPDKSGTTTSWCGPYSLNTADLTAIKDRDPYWNCTYKSGIGSTACPDPDSTRYTITGSEDLLYEQAVPGQTPPTKTFTQKYSNTSTQGQSAEYTSTHTLGMETVFKGHLFGYAFTDTLSQSNTMTSVNGWNDEITSSTTSDSVASITWAPCAVSGTSCSPAYPPGNAYNAPQGASCTALSNPQAYGQAYEFDVYEDNLFGTFLLVPAAY